MFFPKYDCVITDSRRIMWFSLANNLFSTVIERLTECDFPMAWINIISAHLMECIRIDSFSWVNSYADPPDTFWHSDSLDAYWHFWHALAFLTLSDTCWHCGSLDVCWHFWHALTPQISWHFGHRLALIALSDSSDTRWYTLIRCHTPGTYGWLNYHHAQFRTINYHYLKNWTF